MLFGHWLEREEGKPNDRKRLARRICVSSRPDEQDENSLVTSLSESDSESLALLYSDKVSSWKMASSEEPALNRQLSCASGARSEGLTF